VYVYIFVCGAFRTDKVVPLEWNRVRPPHLPEPYAHLHKALYATFILSDYHWKFVEGSVRNTVICERGESLYVPTATAASNAYA